MKHIIKLFNDTLSLSPDIREETKKRYLQESEDNDMFNLIVTEGDGLNIIIHDNDNIDNNKNLDTQFNYQIDRWLQHF